MRSSAITVALINKLLADAALMALTPDGVFKDVAGASMADGGSPKRFVIVSLVTSADRWEFRRRAFEDALYLVEARMLSSVPGANVEAAGERIDALLDPQPPQPPATLTVPGYGLMDLARDEAVESTEFDDGDASIQWNRCGGRYRVKVATT
jgi:hypothetical protein